MVNTTTIHIISLYLSTTICHFLTAVEFHSISRYVITSRYIISEVLRIIIVGCAVRDNAVCHKGFDRFSGQVVG